MKVVIIGTGNVGTILSELIQKAGHEIVQVVGRNIDHARELADKHNTATALITDAQFLPADIYIVALNDVALERLEKITGLKNKFVVHTAGSVPMNVFKSVTSTYGILYPLQTLSKITQAIPAMPILVEGDSKESLNKITEFAKSLTDKVISVTEAERLHYHIAAVFAANFSNHLFAIAENFCKSENIDFKNLLPLINEMNSRLGDFSPKDVQTGPAVREDIFTINRHLQALSTHPEMKYLYLKLSESILKMHEKH